MSVGALLTPFDRLKMPAHSKSHLAPRRHSGGGGGEGQSLSAHHEKANPLTRSTLESMDARIVPSSTAYISGEYLMISGEYLMIKPTKAAESDYDETLYPYEYE